MNAGKLRTWAVLRVAAVFVLAAALLVPTAAPADGPTAKASLVSKRTAKKWIRQRIRQRYYVIPGSILVGNCGRGYTANGHPRWFCDTYWESSSTFEGICGWGRVTEFLTFHRVEAKITRIGC